MVANAHRSLATLYRTPPPVFHYSQWECRPVERNALFKELSHSNYVSHSLTVEYLNKVSVVRHWETDYFKLDLWISDASSKKIAVPTWLRRLETLRRYYKTEKPIQFVCVPMPIPREFPKQSSQCLGRNNVNGGYTYIHQQTVYVFRAEEMPKVLLHEYLHQIQGDKDSEWRQHPNALERIRKLVNIDPSVDIRPNEAIVEYWAWLYSQWFVGLDYGLPKTSILEAEKAFVFSQAKRIYDHQRECQKPYWFEETHVFSYYILKAMLVWIAGRLRNSHDNISLFYNVDSLVALIETHWEEFRQTVLENPEPNKKKNGIWIPNSARMTLLGDF